jgi:hypothetical protein
VTDPLDQLAAFAVRHDWCRGEINVASEATTNGDWQFALACPGCGETTAIVLSADDCRRHLLAFARAAGFTGREDDLWSSEIELKRLVDSPSPLVEAFRREWARRAAHTKH